MSIELVVKTYPSPSAHNLYNDEPALFKLHKDVWDQVRGPAMNSDARGKVKSKTIGVAKLSFEAVEGGTPAPRYVVAISGDGVSGATDKPAKKLNNESLVKLRNYLADRTPSATLADFDSLRESLYALEEEGKSLDDKPELKEMVRKRLRKKVEDVRGLIPNGTSPSETRSIVERWVKSSMWGHRIDANPDQGDIELQQVVDAWAQWMDDDAAYKHAEEILLATKEEYLQSLKADIGQLVDEDNNPTELAVLCSPETPLEMIDRLNGDCTTKEEFGKVFSRWCKDKLGATDAEPFFHIINGTILQYLGYERDPRTTRLLNYVSQCAEDNVLPEIAEIDRVVRVATVTLCSTHTVNRTQKKSRRDKKPYQIEDYLLCHVCDASFEEKLSRHRTPTHVPA